MKSQNSKVWQWFEERLRISEIARYLSHKTVPRHRYTAWYYFGGVALFLFGVQVFTGILLLMYYTPTPEAAYESVRFLVGEVPFGWLIRNTHSWAGNLFVLACFCHMFSAYFMRAYRKPRELTWLTGFLLLGLALGFGFSGYLLPWNELAFFATRVGTTIVSTVPLLGGYIGETLKGGEMVTGLTLSRFFGIHVALLPLIAVLVLLLHLALIQRQGMSEPISQQHHSSQEEAIPFFPHFFLREAMVWLGIMAVLLALSILSPWELGTKADPFASAPVGIKPEWYFTYMSQALKYLPGHILFWEGETVGIVGFMLGGLYLVLVPFLDRGAARGRPNPIFTIIGVCIIVFMVVMITLAYTVG